MTTPGEHAKGRAYDFADIASMRINPAEADTGMVIALAHVWATLALTEAINETPARLGLDK